MDVSFLLGAVYTEEIFYVLRLMSKDRDVVSEKVLSM